MSTRSYIGYIENGVYCHKDGYIEYNSVILNESYDTIDKVKSLISHGDISLLNDSLESCKFFNTPTSYEILKLDTSEINSINEFIQYIYIFNTENKKNGMQLIGVTQIGV